MSDKIPKYHLDIVREQVKRNTLRNYHLDSITGIVKQLLRHIDALEEEITELNDREERT